jgi:RNA polymerase subunit RPABC4/transcription elongation factor Spt4
MYCTTCGTSIPDDSRFCPGCGTSQENTAHAPGASTASRMPGGVAAVARSSVPVWTIDVRRLRVADFVAGGAALVVLVTLFLPWYVVHVGEGYGSYSYYTDAIGGEAGGWRILILVASVAILVYLFVRTAMKSDVVMPLPHWQLLIGATGLELLLVIVAFIAAPSGQFVTAPGAAVGLIAAVVAVVSASFSRSVVEPIAPESTAPASTAPGLRIPSSTAIPRGAGAHRGGDSAASPNAPADQAQLTHPRPETGGWGGATTRRACSACGQVLDRGARFCTGCGART